MVKNSVAENVQRMLGRTIIIDPNTILHSNVHTHASMQRNKTSRNSSFYKPQSGENSPDMPHKSLNTVQRSMSLLKTKIQSPMVDRAKAHTLGAKSKLSRESKTSETLGEPKFSVDV